MRRSIVACVVALLVVLPGAGHAASSTLNETDSCGGLAPVEMTCTVSATMPAECTDYEIVVRGGGGTTPAFTGYINVQGASMPKWTTYWVAGGFITQSTASPEPVPCGSTVAFDATAVGAGNWSVTLTTS